ncbi:hypothetical protein QA802_07855 [Streptomyces sp. B21-105]|uniref:hypothetical protein n=1 Tax=Streptomyces sp. B21-105 TaxID=3039417 RepID=UPI002FF15830
MTTITRTKCWNCAQLATNVMTRKGSESLLACDNCTRIDRAEAERRGWTITPINGARPVNRKPINTPGGFRLTWRSFGYHLDPVQHQRTIGKHVYVFRSLPDRIDVWRSEMLDGDGGYRWTLVHSFR